MIRSTFPANQWWVFRSFIAGISPGHFRRRIFHARECADAASSIRWLEKVVRHCHFIVSPVRFRWFHFWIELCNEWNELIFKLKITIQSKLIPYTAISPEYHPFHLSIQFKLNAFPLQNYRTNAHRLHERFVENLSRHSANQRIRISVERIRGRRRRWRWLRFAYQNNFSLFADSVVVLSS